MDGFSEKQRFTQWWLWLIIISSGLLPVIIALAELSKGKFDTTGFVVGICISAVLGVLFSFLRLTTAIDESGITYQFTFYNLRPVKRPWSEIERAFVRKYSPLGEFGGWGIRYSMKRSRGMALNIAGDMGLQLIFKNGGRLLLGTQRPDEIKELLQRLVDEGKIDKSLIDPSDVNV